MDERCIDEVNKSSIICYGPNMLDPLFGFPKSLIKCAYSKYEWLSCRGNLYWDEYKRK